MQWEKVTSRNLLTTDDRVKTTTFLNEFYNIVSLSAFRRLQDKAQVFPLKTGDFIRTRLTHSIEVMSTAEEIGDTVSNKLKEKELQNFIGKLNSIKTQRGREEAAYEFSKCNRMFESISQILKSASIIHDMGNPPFGHIGEDIISDWFKKNIGKYYIDKTKSKIGPILKKEDISETDLNSKRFKKISEVLSQNQKLDLENFEGNAQLLRIMLKLNSFNREYSVALLGACMKYTCSSSNKPPINKCHNVCEKKIGYFTSEESAVQKLFDLLESEGVRSPLAFLLEAADDISYLLSDLEDAIKRNLVSYDDLYAKLKRMSIKSGSDEIKNAFDKIKEFHKKSKSVSIQVANFKKIYREFLIDDVSATFINNCDLILAGRYERELLSDGKFSSVIKCFANLLKTKVYHSRVIAIEKTKVHTILTTLLDSIVPAAFFLEKTPSKKGESKEQMICELISQNYKEECKSELRRIDSSTDNKETKFSNAVYAVLRLAVDEISGMTDLYALHMYEIINAL